MRYNLLLNSLVLLYSLFLFTDALSAQEPTPDTLYYLVQSDGASQQVNPGDIVNKFVIETKYVLASEEAQARYNYPIVVEYYLRNRASFSSALDEEIFKVVEENPRFPGCEDLAESAKEKEKCAKELFLEFINLNLEYPEDARYQSIQGWVLVRFVVEKNGTLTDLELVRDIGNGCGEEALRLVDLMNVLDIRWIPGKQRGIPVRVQYNLPISFKLER